MTLTLDRFRPKSIGFVRWGIWTCRKKMEMISQAVRPVSCWQTNKQKNKWKRSKRATLAKSIFFLTLTVDRFRPKFKSFVPSGICTCRKKMEMISQKWWPVSGYQIWQNRKLTYTVTSVIRHSDARSGRIIYICVLNAPCAYDAQRLFVHVGPNQKCLAYLVQEL